MYFTHYGRRFHFLAIFLAAAIAALVYFWISSWQPPGGTFVLFVTVGGVVVAIVSDNKPLSRNEKIGWLVFTGIVAFLEICVLVRADGESKKARAVENASFVELLNRAKETVSNMTGGDSFPWVDVEIQGGGRLFVSKLRVEGKYSLRQVQLRVVNADGLKQINQYRSAVSTNEWLSAQNKAIRDFAQVSPDGPRILDDEAGVDGAPAMEKRYDCVISADNGSWSENIRLKFIDGEWKHAIRLRQAIEKKPESEWPERKLDISKGFPTTNGKPDWDN